jgi:hypothetical protein
MNYTIHKKGLINGVKFEIIDANTINVWKPAELDLYSFRSRCNFIVRYLIDEGFFNNRKCKVNIIT